MKLKSFAQNFYLYLEQNPDVLFVLLFVAAVLVSVNAVITLLNNIRHGKRLIKRSRYPILLVIVLLLLISTGTFVAYALEIIKINPEFPWVVTNSSSDDDDDNNQSPTECEVIVVKKVEMFSEHNKKTRAFYRYLDEATILGYQVKLCELGELDEDYCTGKANDHFIQAVINLQEKSDLYPDGKVGPETEMIIFSK